MLKTTMELVNKKQIEGILQDIVQSVYENIKHKRMLLNISRHDIDLYTVVEDDDNFQAAIERNFEYDENLELVDEASFQILMDELNDYFIELHKTSAYFDYFPVGVYEVNGETRQTNSEHIAIKGDYQGPFMDARVIFH